MAITSAVSDHDAGLLVALSGNLELTDVALLRLRLFKCLAEQPSAVLIDLARLSVAEPLAMTVFTVVARQAARWPGTPVLLCAPTGATRAILAEAAYRRLSVFPDVDAAAAGVGSYRRSLPVITDELLPIAGAARQARNVATDACLRWELPRLIAPASLIADELVSNVADHASTMATLRLTVRYRYLTIAVQDGSEAPPVIAPGPDAGRGRGLLLVAASAHSWGWMPTEDGKVVWASLAI